MKGTQKFLTTIVVETGRPPQDSGPHGPVNSNTDGNQAGLWPTPRAQCATGASETETREGAADLQTAVKQWATPRSGKTSDENQETWEKRQAAGDVSTMPLTLQVKAAWNWVTPRVAEAEHSGRRTNSGHQAMLAVQAQTENPKAKLNPHWVASLMGYPPLWAEIGKKFVKPAKQKRIRQSQTELANLKATETP